MGGIRSPSQSRPKRQGDHGRGERPGPRRQKPLLHEILLMDNEPPQKQDGGAGLPQLLGPRHSFYLLPVIAEYRRSIHVSPCFATFFAVKERPPEPPAPFLPCPSPAHPGCLGKGALHRSRLPHSPVWGLSLGIPARHRPASASPAYNRFEATQDIFHFP